MKSRAKWIIGAASVPLASACVIVSVSRGTNVESVEARPYYDVKSPVKAHLNDGSTVI